MNRTGEDNLDQFIKVALDAIRHLENEIAGLSSQVGDVNASITAERTTVQQEREEKDIYYSLEAGTPYLVSAPDTMELRERERELTEASIRASTLERRLNDSRFNHFRPIPVADDIPVEIEIYLREQAHLFPGVVVERKTVRSYPYGSLAAHLLGELPDGMVDPDRKVDVDPETGRLRMELLHDRPDTHWSVPLPRALRVQAEEPAKE